MLSDRRPQLLTLGIAGALWVASTGFHTLADVLNRVHGVPEQRPCWRVRLIALAMALALPLLVLCASLLMIVGPRLGGRLAGWLHLGGAFEVAWNLLRVPVALVVMVFVVAVVYHVLPSARLRWRWISPGSAIAVPLWVAVSHGFSVYVSSFGNFSATYGSLGAVVVLLVWLYLSALVVLLGAEINELCEPRGAARSRRETGAPAATPPLRPDGPRAPEVEPA